VQMETTGLWPYNTTFNWFFQFKQTMVFTRNYVADGRGY